MEEQVSSQPIQRKSYQTDSRPLADVIFAIVVGAAMAFAGAPLFGGVPMPIAIGAMSIATAMLYKAYIDVLTVFHVPVRSALFSALIVSALSRWLSRGNEANDLVMLIFNMPIFTIAVCHMLDGWRRKR